MLRTIHLYGQLGDEFGREHRLAVKTPREAVRALCVLFKGFRARFHPGQYYVVRGRELDTGFGINHETIDMRLGRGDLHVVPLVEGEGGRGMSLGKIVLGIALIAGAFFFLPAAGFMIAGVSVFSAGSVAMMGASMVLSGVAQLMSPTPTAGKGSEGKKSDSFLFDGIESVWTQGGAVPLVYGRMRVGGVVVSVGVSVEEYGGGSSGTGGGRNGPPVLRA